MLLSFKPSIGSTILDVCLNVYLSLNLLPKLIEDNGITNLNAVTGIGEEFIYDTEFIYDEFESNEVMRNQYKFVTGDVSMPNASFTSGDYLLIESGAILSSDAGELFLI